MKKGGRKHGTAYEQYGFISQVNEGKYIAICRYCNRKLQNTSGARLRVHRKNCSVHAVTMKNYEPGTAYEQYGFISQVHEGKYIAICRYCNRKLQNTGVARLRVHRKNCSVHAVTLKNYEPKTEKPPNSELEMPAPQLGSEIKIENVAMQPFTIWNENHAQNALQIESIQDYLDDNPLRSDMTINSEAMSSSKKLLKLQEQKLESEIHYFQKKSDFLSKEIENQAIKRSLMVLEGKKLRLEIEKLQ